MKPRGQVILIVAFLIMVGLFLLALMVDGGRLYLRRSEAQRAAQAAADAGIGLVAEQMVTLAVPRQTEAAARPACVPDGDYGDTGGMCTATPEPADVAHWLIDEDRQTLVEPLAQSTVEALALNYSELNGFVSTDPQILDLQAQFPHDYQLEDDNLRLRVLIRRRVVVLLAGILGRDYVDLPAEAFSEVPQR
ncbi:MAG: pilus assembly protein TadG-related protein [Anaerolineales bacterium]